MNELQSVDPDKPMKKTGSQAVNFNIHDYEHQAAMLVLVRPAQQLVRYIEESGNGEDWRFDVYRDLFLDVTAHNNEETCSEAEKKTLHASGLAATLLKVRNN